MKKNEAKYILDSQRHLIASLSLILDRIDLGSNNTINYHIKNIWEATEILGRELGISLMSIEEIIETTKRNIANLKYDAIEANAENIIN